MAAAGVVKWAAPVVLSGRTRYPADLAFYDRFGGPNGVLLENHRPNLGTAWAAARSGIEILGGQAHFKSGSAAPLIVDTPVTLAACTLTVLVCPTTGGGEAGFCIRRTGAASTWHYISVTFQSSTTGKMEIVRRNPLNVLATTGSISIIQNYAYIMQVDLAGNDITATLRGYTLEGVTINASDATNAACRTRGLYMNAAGVQLCEFQITP